MILRAMRTYRRERDEWQLAYEAERLASADFAARLTSRIGELDEAMGQERSAWKARVATLERQARKRWSVGLFGGYDPFRREAVCGIGLSYSLIKF